MLDVNQKIAVKLEVQPKYFSRIDKAENTRSQNLESEHPLASGKDFILL